MKDAKWNFQNALDEQLQIDVRQCMSKYNARFETKLPMIHARDHFAYRCAIGLVSR